MIIVREAASADVPAITGIFQACYGADHSDWRFYDPTALNKLVISDDTLVLVAEDPDSGKIWGTASVILEVGAYADLTGEFGRLAVLPEARNQGIGKLLMEERLRRVERRLQVGLIEGRTAHPSLQFKNCRGASIYPGGVSAFEVATAEPRKHGSAGASLRRRPGTAQEPSSSNSRSLSPGLLGLGELRREARRHR
jgi:GNAT superfamily N-acetyltransferase